jgi:hypothetical protein
METLINTLSDILMEDDHTNKIRIIQTTDMMSDLYDTLVPLFGRTDTDLKVINKHLRDIVS